MATHPFFNAGATPKRKPSHPLIEASQPGGWMERAGRVGTAIAGLPGAVAKGVYDEYANTAKFIGKYMDGNTAIQLRGDETITDSGDVYRDGKLVGNMLLDKDALVRSSANVADLAPMSAIGSGAVRVAKGKKAIDPNVVNVGPGPKGKPSQALFDGDPYTYVEPGPPVLRDKKTGKVVSGPHENWREMGAAPEGQFWGKSQTPKEEQLMAAKAAAREQVKMGDYHPFFDVEKRYDADYSKYQARPETATEMGPKTAKAKAKYAELTSDPQLEARLTAAYDNAKADSGAVDWYKMGQLEDAFIQEFGPDEGRRLFQQRFADPMAATTGGMDPETNLLATARANYQSARGLPATAEASHQYPAGIGGGKYGLHGNMQVYDRLMGPEGKGLTLENPKRMNFSSNFLGNSKAVTLDEQMGDLMGHGTTAFNGPAYGPYEGAVRKVADDLGVDPRQFQEIAWAGHKKTKDKTYIPKPMIQIFNEAVARTSKITGLSQEEVVKMFMHAKGPLYAAPAAIIGGAAALSAIPDESGQL